MKSRVALMPLFLLTFLSFTVVIKSFNKSLLAAGLALAGFIVLSTLSAFFFMHIKKQNSENSTNQNQ